MPTPTPDRIRTVAVVGHSHDGKTTLCEALLHTAGATQRMGSTEQAHLALRPRARGATPLDEHRSLGRALRLGGHPRESHRRAGVPGLRRRGGRGIGGRGRCGAGRRGHRHGAGRCGDGLGDDPGGRCPRADRREPHGQGERGVRGDRRCTSRSVRAQADRGRGADRCRRRVQRLHRSRRRPCARL